MINYIRDIFADWTIRDAVEFAIAALAANAFVALLIFL